MTKTYKQTQEIRLYYDLSGIDIDRYDINDKYESIIGLYYIETIFKLLSIIKKSIYYIPGNHDYADMHSFIKLKYVTNVDYLQNSQIFKKNELNILGIGGSPNTPGEWTYEWEDTEINITNKYNYEESLLNVLLTHTPPFGSKLDINHFNEHCGSKRISNLLTNYKFDLVLCGHIHESRGFDFINGMLCLNAGKVGIKTNQSNLKISHFYYFDSSKTKIKIKRYIIGFDDETGYYEYKINNIKY